MIKVLKESSANFKEIGGLNNYLNKKEIEIHSTIHNGIIYGIKDKFYKYYQEGSYPSSIPPLIEGLYVECDSNGNTDY